MPRAEPAPSCRPTRLTRPTRAGVRLRSAVVPTSIVFHFRPGLGRLRHECGRHLPPAAGCGCEGGKFHEMRCHCTLEGYLAEYRERALADRPGPLFQAIKYRPY